MATPARRLVGVAIALVATFALLPSPARATTGVQVDPMALTENAGKVQAIAEDISHTDLTIPAEWRNPATGVAYTAGEEELGLTAAEEAAGTFPTLAVAVGTVFVGSYTIARVANALGCSFCTSATPSYIYKKFLGSDSASWSTWVPIWTRYCAAPCANNSFSAAGFPTITNGWFFTYQSQQSDFAIAPTCPGGGTDNQISCSVQGLLATSTTEQNTAGTRIHIERTDEQMAARLAISQATNSQYEGAAHKVDVGGWNPAPPDSQHVQDYIRKCGGYLGPGVVGTPAQEACRAIVNHKVDSNWTPGSSSGSDTHVVCDNCGTGTGGTTTFKPFILPKPQLDEQYSDYLDRLRGEGWVGTATVADADTVSYESGSPGTTADPGTMTSVKVGTGTAIDVISPLGYRVDWPTNPDEVSAPDAAVEVEKIPGTISSTTGTCTPPAVPSLDFTPLNGHALSDKFPFALFGWLSGIVGDLTVTGEAPTFTIPIDTSVHDWNLTVDLSSADPMMEYLRPILAGFTLLSAIVFGATGALGWGARSPAVDE